MDEARSPEEWHRKFAVDLFNLTWSLLDKEDRSREEDDRMVHATHASRFHWGEVGTPLNFERGEWQISRVYSVLRRGEAALHHARRCLEICRENEIGDFDIAFAYEAMARANSVLNRKDECVEYLELAKKVGAEIEDEGNRNYFFGELKTIRC